MFFIRTIRLFFVFVFSNVLSPISLVTTLSYLQMVTICYQNQNSGDRQETICTIYYLPCDEAIQFGFKFQTSKKYLFVHSPWESIWLSWLCWLWFVPHFNTALLIQFGAMDWLVHGINHLVVADQTAFWQLPRKMYGNECLFIIDFFVESRKSAVQSVLDVKVELLITF